MAFKDLLVGDIFRFARELDPQVNGMPYGPWVKVSARLYRHVDNPSLTYRIGTIHVAVVLEVK